MAHSPNGTTDPAARFGRRRLLQLGAGAAAMAAVPSLLAGCRRADSVLLLAAKGGMPAAWLDELPGVWAQELLAGSGAVVDAFSSAQGKTSRPPGLVSLPDGWASELPLNRLQPFGAAAVLARLAAAAKPVSRLYRPDDQPALAFPWAFSPWVMAFRSEPELAKRARAGEGWAVLADPALKKRVVLPSSPRVSIEICSAALEKLQVLRSQALAYDDANALNLLLTGEASAAVVPLQRLIPLLRRDQRLEVVLPARGAPLSWQVLVRPAGMQVEPPLEWLGALLEAPLLPKVLAAGWVPPLPRDALAPALARVPQPMRSLLLPPDAVLQRCWSLAPLRAERRLAFQTLWDAAAPA